MTQSRDIDRRPLPLAGATRTAPATGSATGPAAASPIIIDSLGSLLDPNCADLDAPQPLSARVMQDARASGLTALNLTLGYIHGPGDPFEFTVRDIVRWDRCIADNPGTLRKITAASDIRSAHAAGELGLIYGFQNEVALGECADREDLFADMGVRVFQRPARHGGSVPQWSSDLHGCRKIFQGGRLHLAHRLPRARGPDPRVGPDFSVERGVG